jgi:electron transfer flavoprotein alpha subunit
MADRILVVAEQREGKLNRVSLETLAAAQAIGTPLPWPRSWQPTRLKRYTTWKGLRLRPIPQMRTSTP